MKGLSRQSPKSVMIPARIDLYAWDAVDMRLYLVEAVYQDESGFYDCVQCGGSVYPLPVFTYFHVHYN